MITIDEHKQDQRDPVPVNAFSWRTSWTTTSATTKERAVPRTMNTMSCRKSSSCQNGRRRTCSWNTHFTHCSNVIYRRNGSSCWHRTSSRCCKRSTRSSRCCEHSTGSRRSQCQCPTRSTSRQRGNRRHEPQSSPTCTTTKRRGSAIQHTPSPLDQWIARSSSRTGQPLSLLLPGFTQGCNEKQRAKHVKIRLVRHNA